MCTIFFFEIKFLKGFSHKKLIFDMLFPLKSYAKMSFTVYIQGDPKKNLRVWLSISQQLFVK